MHPESKTKRIACSSIFAIACRGKKLRSHTEFCEFRDWRILNIGIFHRVEKLSKLNQTWHEVPPV